MRKKLPKNIVASLLVTTMLLDSLLPVHHAEAAISKKSFTVTFVREDDEDLPFTSYEIRTKKTTTICYDTKILAIEGKPEEKTFNYGGIECFGNAIDGAYYDVKRKNFKAGRTLKGTYSVPKSGIGITWGLLSGVDKLKIKVTIRTKDGSAAITKCKKTKEHYNW